MLTITSDVARAEARFRAMVDRQMPFALSQALNDTGFKVREALGLQMQDDFDRPTPFTLRAFEVKRATKSTLEARVQARPVQAPYLALQAEGGSRRPERRALVVPGAVKLNKYGNLPRGALKRLLGRPDVFATSTRSPRTSHLAPGIYQRANRMRLKLLISFEDEAQYAPLFDFENAAQAAAMKEIGPAFARRLEAALASAR
jgi:hypothetical protein